VIRFGSTDTINNRNVERAVLVSKRCLDTVAVEVEVKNWCGWVRRHREKGEVSELVMYWYKIVIVGCRKTCCLQAPSYSRSMLITTEIICGGAVGFVRCVQCTSCFS
jgi:hypothetical protein